MEASGVVIEFPGGRISSPFANLGGLLGPTAPDRSFAPRAVGLDTLEELLALMAVGPGMTGASPTRVLLLTTPTARSRLAARLPPRSRDIAILAPACVLIAYDQAFAEQMLAFASDGADGESCFDEPPRLRAAAMRNSALQGAYLALSARALGLEASFFADFDAQAVTAEFFKEPGLRTIFTAALGYPKADTVA